MFTKHMLRFRNEEIPMVGGIVPEIVLTNSHDGRMSLIPLIQVYFV